MVEKGKIVVKKWDFRGWVFGGGELVNWCILGVGRLMRSLFSIATCL